jgi:uncharacterized cupredoxin-like copper-binding protein
MPVPTKRPSYVLVVLTCLLGLAAGACGGNGGGQGAAQAESVNILGKDFAFKMPATVEAGWTNFVLRATGKQPHSVTFLKLKPNVSFTGFQKVLKSDNTGLKSLEQSEALGGPNAIRPGETQQALVNLEPGDYAFVCFTRGHQRRGMFEQVRVRGETQAKPELPKPDGEFVLKDFDIAVPQSINAGSGTFKVTNSGPSAHELLLVRAEGASLDEVNNFVDKLLKSRDFDVRPPFRPIEVGGMSILSPNKSGLVELNLDPGVYVAICFVPDEKKKIPHAFEGMIKTFEVK